MSSFKEGGKTTIEPPSQDGGSIVVVVVFFSQRCGKTRGIPMCIPTDMGKCLSPFLPLFETHFQLMGSVGGRYWSVGLFYNIGT